MLPRVLERCGNSDRGSMTGIYTVLVEGDDMNDPIADATRGILDGHVVLTRDLASRNHFPAIDVLKSKYQIAPEGMYTGTVWGSKSVLNEIMAKEGILSLWAGATPVFIRAFPANAACFYGMETTKQLLTSAGLE